MFKGHEEQIIKDLVDDILNLEDKIEEITSTKTTEPNEQQRKMLEALQHDLQHNQLIVSSIQSALAVKLEENSLSLKRKQAEVGHIQKSLNEIEDQLRHMAIASTATTQSSAKLYSTSYERIEDFISTKKTNEELLLLEQEYANNESNLQLVKDSIEAKCNKRNELKENVNMMKEERKDIQAQLINLISQKESLEEISKHKLSSMKAKENLLTRKGNVNISFSSANQPSSSPFYSFELYRYEIGQVDLNRTSKELSESLVDSSGDIVQRIHMANMIKNEVIDYLCSFDWSNKTEDLITIITAKGINILQSVSGIKELTEDNLNAFIKTQFKVLYYDKVISYKLAFILKEYKSMKKEFNQSISRINEDISKLTIRKEELEEKIKENKYRMKLLVDSKAKNDLGLSKADKAYIQLNDKLAELQKFKESVVFEINQLIKREDEMRFESTRKIQELEAKNNSINKRKSEIEEEIKANYLKANEEVVQLRQKIADKFRLIKTQLKIYKEQYGDNISLYNKLVEDINCSLRISNIIKASSSMATLTSLTKVEHNPPHHHILSAYKLQPSNMKLNPSNKNRNRNKSYASSSNQPQMLKIPHSSVHKANDSRMPSKDFTNILNNNTNDITANTQSETLKAKNQSTKPNVYSSVSPTRNKHKHKQNYSINTNNTSTLWDDERVKLEKSIQRLKSSISSNECFIDKGIIIDKIKPTLKTTFCYYRVIDKRGNSKRSKYNPLEHSIDNKDLGFLKANVSANAQLTLLSIKEANGRTKEIAIDLIDSTIVTNTMKHIIKIYRHYRRCQMKKVDLEDFVKKEEFKDIPLLSNERIKAAVNQLFNMTLKLTVNQRIEFVFISYDDFKLWLNGIAFILKNRTNQFKFKALPDV